MNPHNNQNGFQANPQANQPQANQSGPIPQDPMDQLKWETARELGLDDDLTNAGDELTVREAGKIGGNMVRKLIQVGKRAMGINRRNQQ